VINRRDARGPRMQTLLFHASRNPCGYLRRDDFRMILRGARAAQVMRAPARPITWNFLFYSQRIQRWAYSPCKASVLLSHVRTSTVSCSRNPYFLASLVLKRAAPSRREALRRYFSTHRRSSCFFRAEPEIKTAPSTRWARAVLQSAGASPQTTFSSDDSLPGASSSSGRISRTTRSCTVRDKGYGAYQIGAAAQVDRW
jgi:hypothetical protein